MTTLAYRPGMDAGELREYIAARHGTHLVNGGSSDACNRARRMVRLLARQIGATEDEVTREVIADFEAMEDFVAGFSGQARRAATLAATYVYNRTVRADYDGACGRDTLATDQVAAMVKSIDPEDAAAILSYIA